MVVDYKKSCRGCGAVFVTKRNRRVFCNRSCSTSYNNNPALFGLSMESRKEHRRKMKREYAIKPEAQAMVRMNNSRKKYGDYADAHRAMLCLKKGARDESG